MTLQGDDSVGCSAEHECCDHVTGTGDNEQEQGVMEATGDSVRRKDPRDWCGVGWAAVYSDKGPRRVMQ